MACAVCAVCVLCVLWRGGPERAHACGAQGNSCTHEQGARDLGLGPGDHGRQSRWAGMRVSLCVWHWRKVPCRCAGVRVPGLAWRAKKRCKNVWAVAMLFLGNFSLNPNLSMNVHVASLNFRSACSS